MKSKLLSKVSNLEHEFEKPDFSKPENYKSVHQTHSTDIASADCAPGTKADALWTQDANQAIAIQTADCMPILIYGKDKEDHPLIVAIHSGWKGTLDGILPKSMKFVLEKGILKESLKIAIGPSIGVCCFEIGDDLFERFLRTWPESKRVGKNMNLKALAFSQLKDLGIDESQIDVLDVCTYCTPGFDSYRRSTHQNTKSARQWSWIKLTSF